MKIWALLVVLLSSFSLFADENENRLIKGVDYLDAHPTERAHYINEEKFQVVKEARLKKRLGKLRFNSPKIPHKSGNQFVLQSELEVIGDLGSSIEANQNLSNQARHFGQLRMLLPETLHKNFPSTEEFLSYSEKQRESLFQQLRDQHRKLRIAKGVGVNQYWQSPPSYYVESCTGESGSAQSTYSDYADYSRRCSATNYNPSGLYANFEFPLKYHTTCVKSQGNRGSCVGFAITAAVEALSYKDKKKAVNISEQFTYSYAEVYGGSSLGTSGRYDYGLNVGNSLSVLDSKNAYLQYENRWYYNPSYGMADEINSSNKFSNSCPTRYVGQLCTDYAFQSTETVSGSWPFKSYSYTFPSKSSTTKWEITNKTSFWNILARKNSLEDAVTYVQSGIPVVLGFEVKTNFSDANKATDGYVRWDSSSENEGGHAVLLIGYVANEDLPAGVTSAVGDGYFIMKNSWGNDSADCGFFYVDDEYLKNTATSLHTITVSHPSSY